MWPVAGPLEDAEQEGASSGGPCLAHPLGHHKRRQGPPLVEGDSIVLVQATGVLTSEQAGRLVPPRKVVQLPAVVC